MTDTGKSNLTRRQFGWKALGYGAAATLGVGAATAGGWLLERRKRQYANAIRPDVTGMNSLEARAAAKGLVYGAAVAPRWLDVDGAAKSRINDAYTQLVTAQTGVLVDEYTSYWKWLRPSPDRRWLSGH